MPIGNAWSGLIGHDVRVGGSVVGKQRWWRAPWPNPWLGFGVAFLVPFSTALLWPMVMGGATQGADPVLVAIVVISAAAVAVGIAVWLRDRSAA